MWFNSVVLLVPTYSALTWVGIKILAHGLWRTYYRAQKDNYEINGILCKIKQDMQHILKMQRIFFIAQIYKMNF